MRGTTFAGLALLCSGCLEPRSCLELYTCPPDADASDVTLDASADSSSRDQSTLESSVDGEVTTSSEVETIRDAEATESEMDGAIDSADAASVSDGDAGSGIESVDGSEPDAGWTDADGIGASSIEEPLRVTQVVTGGTHTCALLENGKVRCWGDGTHGQLGYGNTNNVGDDEVPASAGDVVIGGSVVSLSAGGAHTCALLENGKVRCWGDGSNGQLGYGNTEAIGDDEAPASAGDVDVGGNVVSLSAGDTQTCAVLDTGAVRCWGSGSYGRLGYGNTETVGDDETPASKGDIELGDTATSVSAGDFHACVLVTDGRVRCFGDGTSGRLGYGNRDAIGDDEAPSTAGNVNIGEAVTQIDVGASHSCAAVGSGNVRCWGANGYGQLGYDSGEILGDDEEPNAWGDVEIGGDVASLSAGGDHACALLTNGRVRCWGRGENGELGYGNHQHIGDDEVPSAAGDVNVGVNAIAVSAGARHTCALLETGQVRCWGQGAYGALGYGNPYPVGMEDQPANAGDVRVVW